MLRTLVYKELLHLIRDRKYLLYWVCTVMLLAGSFSVLVVRYQQKLASHNSLSARFNKDAMINCLSSLAHQGLNISYKPKILQTLVQGTETAFTRFSFIGQWQMAGQFDYPYTRSEPDFLGDQQITFLPALDFALIVTVILSLMVICFSYNSVSGEREQGTLKLLLSYSVPRYKVILAKLTGGYATIIFPVIFSFLTCLLISLLSENFALSATDMAAALGIMLLALLYLLVLYLLGIFVSITCQKSATAIAVLVIIWLVFIIIVHNSSILILERSAQTDYIEQKLSKLKEEYKMMDEKLGSRLSKGYWWGEFAKAQPEQKQQWMYEQVQVVGNHLSTALSDYIRTLERTANWLDRIVWFSPSLLFTSAATEMADTGVRNHILTLRSVVDYHWYEREQLLKIGKEVFKKDTKMIFDYWFRDGYIPYKDMQKYKTPFATLGQRVEVVMGKAFALALYAVLFFLLAFFSFLKTDVT